MQNTETEIADVSPVESFVAVWNDNCGNLAKAERATDKRAKAINARLSEIPSLNYWRDIVKQIAASKFCQGENDRGWKASFDFFIRPDTHIKTLEGQYADRKPFVPKTNAAVSSRPECAVFKPTVFTDDLSPDQKAARAAATKLEIARAGAPPPDPTETQRDVIGLLNFGGIKS